MKKWTLVFLLLIAFSGSSVYAQQNVIIDMGLESKREVPIRGETDDDIGIPRSAVIHPLQVFISGTQLTVDFFEPISNVTITVVNVLTNEVVFGEVYNMPGAAVIDLSNEGVGEYQVKFALPSSSLWGDFSIK